MEKKPPIIKDEFFIPAFEKAELSRLNQADLDRYEMNLKVYRDLKNTVDTAFDDGKIEGIIQGKIEGKIEGMIEAARNGKKLGLDMETLIKLTGLSKERIEQL
jgi:predicted transposase/invertase (TIGR01784 family)